MARDAELRARITAEDDASRVIDKVADRAEDLESKPVTVRFRGDTAQVEGDIDDVLAKVDRLAGTDAAKLTLTSNAARVGQEIADLVLEIDELDASDPTIDAKVANIQDLEAGLERLSSKAKEITGQEVSFRTEGGRQAFDDIVTGAGQAQSATANMVGNIAQDFGELGGITGSAGVAVGQLAEYFTDSSFAAREAGQGISQIAKSFLTAAGPIAGLALGYQLVSNAIRTYQQTQEVARQKTAEATEAMAEQLGVAEQLTSALDPAATAADAFASALEPGDLSKASQAMGALGMTVEDLGPTLIGIERDSKSAIQALLEMGGVPKDVSGDLAELIDSTEDWGEVTGNAFKFLGQGGDEVVAKYKDVILAAEELNDQQQNYDVETIAQGFLDQARGATEASGALVAQAEAAARSKDANADAVAILDEYVRLAGDVGRVGAEWAKANKPIEDMPATWDTAAAAVERLRDGQRLTGAEQRAVTVLMEQYGMTAEEVYGRAAELADQNAEAVKRMGEAAQDYATIVGSADWGAATLEGAAAGAERFAEAQFGLVNIAAEAEASYDALNQAIKDNGFTFDLNTDAGRANAEVIQSLYQSQIPGMAAAFANADGSISAFRNGMDDLRANVIQQLNEETELTPGQIEEVVRQMGLIPRNVSSQFQMMGTEDANAKLALLSGVISSLPADVQRNVTLSVLAGDPQAALAQIEASVTGQPLPPATVPIEGDPGPFERTAQDVTSEERTSTVDLEANRRPADRTANDFTGQQRTTVPVSIDASTALAAAIVLAFVSKPRTTTIYVGTSGVPGSDAAINAAARDRTSHIYVDSWIRSYPSAGEIANRIGTVRVPVDAYLRSTPRITGNL